MKPWDSFQPLSLIGRVVDITLGNKTYKSVLLENLKVPKQEEDRVQVYFITQAGQGVPGYIRSRAVSIIATGEKQTTPVKDYDLGELAGDQP